MLTKTAKLVAAAVFLLAIVILIPPAAAVEGDPCLQGCDAEFPCYATYNACYMDAWNAWINCLADPATPPDGEGLCTITMDYALHECDMNYNQCLYDKDFCYQGCS